MRHRNKNKILGREKGPRELMLRNLASSILIYEKVKTTNGYTRTTKLGTRAGDHAEMVQIELV